MRDHAMRKLTEIEEVVRLLRLKLEDEHRTRGRQGYDCRVAETFSVIEEIAREAFMHEAGEVTVIDVYQPTDPLSFCDEWRCDDP